nr:aldo/keto reductase [Adlercreutzia caecimuris]
MPPTTRSSRPPASSRTTSAATPAGTPLSPCCRGTGDVEAYRAMERALAAGKLRAIGLSCYYVDELTAFLPRVPVKPALVQNEIHPYYQDTDVVPFIHDQGIAVQAWYPLGGRGRNDELLSDPVLAFIAQTHDVSIPQVILRWDLQRGVIAIPGSSNPAHIEEDTQLYQFALTEEEMAAIAALNRNEKHDWY